MKRLSESGQPGGRSLVLFSVLLGGLLVIGLAVALPTLRNGKELSMNHQDSSEPAARRDIPPLDAAAPAEFETATFALG